MSSQKGNVSRSRGQKYQNSVSFKNDRYGATVQVKVREPHASLLSSDLWVKKIGMRISLNVVKVYLLGSSFNVEGEIEDPRRPMSTLQRCPGMESQVQQIQITNTGTQMVSNSGIGL